ncbi:OmpA family protein [Vibrio mimicus]|uniref:MotY family protein n=1 Tax=Vibrio mimicus TaxID=674 RepID=UPI0011D36F77|nr:OmpA family protein [Vibrio mimicus]TXZ75267.1 OmpA family protein [Vibrio mimicus]
MKIDCAGKNEKANFVVFYGVFYVFFAFLFKFVAWGKVEEYRYFFSRLIMFLISIVVCIINSSLAFSNQNINIPMNFSNWIYQAGDLECNLMSADFPYGKFYFRSDENNNITFVVSLNQNGWQWGNAMLKIKNAPWEKASDIKSVSSVWLPNSGAEFIFERNISHVLTSINQGKWMMLSLRGSNSSADQTITIPTVNIQEALQSFLSCRDRLLLRNQSTVQREQLPKMPFLDTRDREVVIYFAFGQRTLSNEQKMRLRALYRYIVEDSRVNKVLVDGYTDNVGPSVANLTISRQRAKLIAKELNRLGLAEEKVEVRAHGLRYPVASNDTAAGQAKNRRVTLRLVRDNEQVVPADPAFSNVEKGKIQQ